MKYLYIDFEYCRSQEQHPDLVCVAWKTAESETIEGKWLYHDPKARTEVADLLRKFHRDGYTFCSFAVTAEARCLHALGIDPVTVKWVDLYLEWRQLRNCYDKFNYGTYFVRNITMRSVPPVHDRPHLNQGRDNTQVPYSLEGACARMLKVNIDSILKKGMRDLILRGTEYTREEQEDILEYCKSDIMHLPALRHNMTKELSIALRTTEQDILGFQLVRGEYSAHVALMESHGIPLHLPSIHNLRRNIEGAKDKLISDLVDNHWPFYIRKKKKSADLLGAWVDTYSQFESYLEERVKPKLVKAWKKTDSGRFCQDDDYLSNFDNEPALSAYRQVRKLLNQLKWLRQPQEGQEDLFDFIGSDGRIRTFFGSYGTQTARNAPQAKRFVFAMSAWLRCLIRPPQGYVITELDYGSQEFAIGAILSMDQNMIEAYVSGDPYLYFAKKAKAVPPDGTKEEYKKERNLFKATTLGLQYGMGYKSLALKLSSDMGETVSEAKAQKLIDLHKSTYRTYWRWLEKVERKYRRQGFLFLPCGWALLKDNPSALSVRNFPTQGGGSSIIREAVRMLKQSGIKVIATLHDSCYIETPDSAPGKKQIATAKRVLEKAFNRVLGQTQVKIRIDVESHPSDRPWISTKGKHYYDLLKAYLDPQETKEDLKEKLMGTIFN